MAAHQFGGLRQHASERGRRNLVGFGENGLPRHGCVIEQRHQLEVDRLGPVPGIDQQEHARQRLAAAQIGAHQLRPRRHLVLGRLRESVARHVHEKKARVGVLADEEVQLLRAAGRIRCARQTLVPHDRIQQARFADVGAPCKRDFRAIRVGQHVDRRHTHHEPPRARRQRLASRHVTVRCLRRLVFAGRGIVDHDGNRLLGVNLRHHLLPDLARRSSIIFCTRSRPMFFQR